MSPTYKKKFSELCIPGSPGYALDYARWIQNKKMVDAIEDVKKRIDKCIKMISKGWRRQVKKFYIGKSHFNSIKGKKFSPTNPATWRLGNGINQRYRDHFTQNHGRNGLIVVAVVTKESIHWSHLSDRTIAHQEEYALILEKRLIQKFKKQDPSRLANRTQEPGKTDKETSIAYAVYITFTMEDWKEKRYFPMDHYTTSADEDLGLSLSANFSHEHNDARLRKQLTLQLDRNDHMTDHLPYESETEEYQRILSPSPFHISLPFLDSCEESDEDDSTLSSEKLFHTLSSGEVLHTERLRKGFSDSTDHLWDEDDDVSCPPSCRNTSTLSAQDDVIVIEKGSTPQPKYIVISDDSDSSYSIQSKAPPPTPDIIVIEDDSSPATLPACDEIATCDDDEFPILTLSNRNSANLATPTRPEDNDASSAQQFNKKSTSDSYSYRRTARETSEMDGISEKIPTPIKNMAGRSIRSFLPLYPGRKRKLSCLFDEEKIPLSSYSKKRKSLSLDKKRPK